MGQSSCYKEIRSLRRIMRRRRRKHMTRQKPKLRIPKQKIKSNGKCKAKCKVKARPRRGAHPPIFTLLLYTCPSRLQAPCSFDEAEVLPAIVYDSSIRMAGLNSYYGMIQRTFQRVYVKVSRLVYDRGGPLSLPPCLLASLFGFIVQLLSTFGIQASVCAE